MALVLLLMLMPVQAAPPQPGADSGLPSQTPTQHDVFWSLSNAQGPAGYLLGTIHSEDARVLEFTGEFLQQLNGCGTFAMELVPDFDNMRQLMELMQLPESQSLEALLGAERFAATASALQDYGVPPAQIQRMKPWAAMMTMSVPPPQTGQFLDFALSLRASANGNRVVGLETLQGQLSFLEQLDLPGQLQLLDQAVAEAGQVQAVHDEMVTIYLESDLATLEQQAVAQMNELDENLQAYFMSEGIEARNRRMAQAAAPLLNAGCTFIAVGALHLPGESGLIRLLRDSGYQLEVLPSPFQFLHPEP
jgi:uncharacterized protein YbaP (TraB family)